LKWPVKVLLNTVGTVSLLLGVLGVFLPLLPATPFLLLASACYLRGSERLHRRLMGNRLLGGYIRNFQQGQGIPLRAKVVTIALLWASLLYSIYRIDVLLVDIMLCVVGATTTTLVLRMKTLKERPGGRGPSGDGGAIGS